MRTLELSRKEKTSFILVGFAVLWCTALIIAGCVVPAYQSSQAPSLTLLQENGSKVLYPLCAPLVIVAIVSLLMFLRKWRSLPIIGTEIWTLAVVLGMLTLISLLTIGPFLIPAAALLVVACAIAA